MEFALKHLPHITPKQPLCFSALPGGNRNDNENFNDAGNNGNWWSSTENDASNAYNRNLNYNDADLNANNDNKSFGFSVRCLRDCKNVFVSRTPSRLS